MLMGHDRPLEWTLIKGWQRPAADGVLYALAVRYFSTAIIQRQRSTLFIEYLKRRKAVVAEWFREF